MFASGIFWDINSIHDASLRELVFVYNPVAFLIDSYRQVLMENSLYSMSHLAWLAGAILAGLVLCHHLLHKTSRTIAAKVINA